MKEYNKVKEIISKKFRTHISKEGTLFLAGRTDENNEKLIAQVQPSEIVFHTEMAGSPFVNIKGEPKGRDEKEAAIMCARYSRDWKKNNSDIEVHKFIGRNIKKTKGMKTGTFGVRNAKDILVKKEDIESFVANPAKKGELMSFEDEGII